MPATVRRLASVLDWPGVVSENRVSRLTRLLLEYRHSPTMRYNWPREVAVCALLAPQPIWLLREWYAARTAVGSIGVGKVRMRYDWSRSQMASVL